jgi:hypothetical protein
MSVTHLECVFVFLSIQHEMLMRMRHIDIFGVPGFTIFFHIYDKRHDFGKKILKHKTCVFILSITFVWNISHYKKNWARYDQTRIVVSSSGPALANPGFSTVTVLPSSGYHQRHPYARAPPVTTGYNWIISRGVASCIQSVSSLVLVRGLILIMSPKKTKWADWWRALTVVALALSV